MKKDIIFGMCADVHQNNNPDVDERMKKFIHEANERKADFIVQLGDFALPDEGGKKLLNVWNQFDGPKYHVLGNHDTEHYGKKKCMEFLGQKDKYFSFDCGNYHFIVLDTNYFKIGDEYIDYDVDNYHSDFFNCYLPDHELEWFKEDIRNTQKRCFIFSHAPLVGGDWNIYNIHAFMDIVYMENQRCGFNKVTMCFAGHDHADAYLFKGGVHYMLVNSMCHKYIGNMYNSARNAEAVRKASDVELNALVWYKDPLYAFVKLQSNGLIRIIGKQTEWVGYSPFELHWEHHASPQISYRELWMNGYGEFDEN